MATEKKIDKNPEKFVEDISKAVDKGDATLVIDIGYATGPEFEAIAGRPDHADYYVFDASRAGADLDGIAIVDFEPGLDRIVIVNHEEGSRLDINNDVTLLPISGGVGAQISTTDVTSAFEGINLYGVDITASDVITFPDNPFPEDPYVSNTAYHYDDPNTPESDTEFFTGGTTGVEDYFVFDASSLEDATNIIEGFESERDAIVLSNWNYDTMSYSFNEQPPGAASWTPTDDPDIPNWELVLTIGGTEVNTTLVSVDAQPLIVYTPPLDLIA
jgi:hypothetical protein